MYRRIVSADGKSFRKDGQVYIVCACGFNNIPQNVPQRGMMCYNCKRLFSLDAFTLEEVFAERVVTSRLLRIEDLETNN